MRVRRIAAAVVAALAVAPVAGVSAHGDKKRLEVSRGESVFWNGGHINTSATEAPDRCGSEPCWQYELHVRGRGHQLRIGFDHPQVNDTWRIEIYRPDGSKAGTLQEDPMRYSAEFVTAYADRGEWHINVIPKDVSDSSFRMRAKLEARAPRFGGREKILPNLQILPPHDASFLFPITNGLMEESMGADVAGRASCHAEEHAEDRAIRCLRFSYGVRNTGQGGMQLHDSGGPVLDRVLYQRIFRGDGSHVDHEAGIAKWHKTHAHFHHDGAIALQLFAVTDARKGKLEAASAKRRKGFTHSDELLREWTNFYPVWPEFGWGLEPGWADIYEWDRPGNYVDFGLNPDGRYIVRMWADPVKGIVESNERDNMGYTYLKVEGSDVRVLETGRGKHPWDRCKILVGPGGFPDPKNGPRPRSCPPDTV